MGTPVEAAAVRGTRRLFPCISRCSQTNISVGGQLYAHSRGLSWPESKKLLFRSACYTMGERDDVRVDVHT